MGKRRKGRHPRRINVREIRQRFLIVCEGEKTEPNYFHGFKSPGCVIHIKGLGKNPLTLIKKTIEKSKDDEYDQIWCVFDKDENSNQEINLAFTKAKQNNISVAFSNEAFELWFLLHFEYLNVSQSRQQLINLLQKYIPDYEKNSSEVFSNLLPYIDIAQSNSKRLLDSYSDYIPNNANPSTTVHSLVMELRKHSVN